MANDPGKWLGLLRWSTQYSDGTAPSPARAMSAEDRAFLEEVMRTCVIDEVQRMGQIRDILLGQDPAEVFAETATEEAKAAAAEVGPATPEEEAEYRLILLEELRDLLEHIDNAKTFAKIGGLSALLPLVREEGPLRAGALEAVGAMCQNNPVCQNHFLQEGLLAELGRLIMEEGVDAEVGQKAMFAMSCLIRGHTKAETAFCAGDGFLVLAHAAQSPAAKLRRKALFMLRALLDGDARRAWRARETGLLEVALRATGDAEDLDCREKALELVTAGALTLLPEERALLAEMQAVRLAALDALEGEEAQADGQFERELWGSVASVPAASGPPSPPPAAVAEVVVGGLVAVEGGEEQEEVRRGPGIKAVSGGEVKEDFFAPPAEVDTAVMRL